MATTSSATASTKRNRYLMVRIIGSLSQGSSGSLAVQPIAQELARLEERHMLLVHLDSLAGAGIAANPRLPLLDREGAETAQLHPVAAGHGGDHLLEDGVHDALHIALVQVRIFLRNDLDEFGSDHLPPQAPRPAAAG